MEYKARMARLEWPGVYDIDKVVDDFLHFDQRQPGRDGEQLSQKGDPQSKS